MLSFISNTFISKAKLKLTKIHANAKQHPEAELSLPENCSYSLFTLSTNKSSRREVFFSKCEEIRSFLRIWSHLLKKSLMENFIFCAAAILEETIQIYERVSK